MAIFVALCVGAFMLNPTSPKSKLALGCAAGAFLLTGCAWALGQFWRWARSWENARRLLFALVCGVTLIGLAYGVENWRGRSAWEKHRRAAEARGEPFALEMVVPPAVPDSQNFAMTPLLAPLLDFTDSPKGIVWRDTNAYARSQGLSAELRPERHSHDHLVLGNLEKGTFADLAACAEFYRGNTNYPQAGPNAAPAERILVALGKFEAELDELRKAAAERPYARFPVRYDTQPSWNILLPHLARVKSIAILVNVRALAELEAGRPADAFEDFKLALRLSESVRDEPILISHLVRVAMLSMTLQTFREALVRHAWNEAQLAELEQRLGAINLLAEYKHAMRGERVCTVRGLDYLRRTRDRSSPVEELQLARWYRALPGGWIYQNMLTVSRLHQEFTLPAVDELAHRVNPELIESGMRSAEEMRNGPYTLFAKALMPGIGKVALRPAQVQTFVDAARVAGALERFRLAEGKLPPSTEALTPKYLKELPKDLIDGKPLRFRANPDGGYILYSVGWNRSDEGGEVGLKKESPASRLEMTKGVEITKGDWVWRML